VTVEVPTTVVPEGGELPSDEELAAMEAAERPAPAPTEAEGPSEIEDLLDETPTPETAAEAEAEDEPEWRADAEAALADE
jgi:hypothetical protein